MLLGLLLSGALEGPPLDVSRLQRDELLYVVLLTRGRVLLSALSLSKGASAIPMVVIELHFVLPHVLAPPQ